MLEHLAGDLVVELDCAHELGELGELEERAHQDVHDALLVELSPFVRDPLFRDPLPDVWSEYSSPSLRRSAISHGGRDLVL